MSQTDRLMIRQISKQHRDVVQMIFKQRRGKLSRDEFFHRRKKDWSTRQYAAALSQIKSLYPCTDEEAEAIMVSDIFNSDLPDRGVARRIINEDPDELESALSLSARLDWLDTCHPSQEWGTSHPDVWIALRGLAAGDIAVAQAVVRARRHDSDTVHTASELIYDAVEAVVMKDRPAQKRLAPKIANCKLPECYRAILETFHGIIKNNSSLVAKGLERVLASFRRGEPFDYETIISLHAHALAELAHWVSPKLLEKFEVDGPLPWDRGYYHWLRRQPRSTEYRDLSPYSSLLNRWVHDLEEPAWWHRKPESAPEEQPTSDSSLASENAHREEAERIPVFADCPPTFLMIRAAAPARRNQAWHATQFRDIGRPEVNSVGPLTAESIISWLNPERLDCKNCPWLISARFKGESWIHCIASTAGLVSVERLASSKELQVLTAEFDPQQNRTLARFFKNGSVAAELAVAGKGKDSLEVLSFKSSVKTKEFLKHCKTVRQALDGFFAAFDAKAREIAVLKPGGGLRLLSSDGRAIRVSKLDELGITCYAPLTAAENPAGVHPARRKQNR